MQTVWQVLYGSGAGVLGTIRANSEWRANTLLGLLTLTLRDGAFDWALQPIPGHTLADAGSTNSVR